MRTGIRGRWPNSRASSSCASVLLFLGALAMVLLPQDKGLAGHVPVGQQLDAHLRLLFAQVTRNSAMDLKNILFVASNFRADPARVKEVYNRSFSGLQKGLTRPQFISVMREALGRVEGGDCDGLVDRARDMSRTFNILDAPSGGHALDELRANKARIFRASPRAPPVGPGPAGVAPMSAGTVLPGGGGLNSARSPHSTRANMMQLTGNGARSGGVGAFFGDGSVPNTPMGDETSRFARGFVTPRRQQLQGQADAGAGTASFMASYSNLTMAAQRPKTSGPGAGGSAGVRPFSLAAGAMSASRRPMSSSKQRPMSGTLGGGGGGGHDVLWKLRLLIKEERMSRLDLQRPFEHYDARGSGSVAAHSAVSVFAELGMRRPEADIVNAAKAAEALKPDGSILYQKLIATLIPVGAAGADGSQSLTINTGKAGSAVAGGGAGGSLTGTLLSSLQGGGSMSSPRVPHDRMLPDKIKTAMMVTRRNACTGRDSVAKLEGALAAQDKAGEGVVGREAFISCLAQKGVDAHHASALAQHFGVDGGAGGVSFLDFIAFLDMGKTNGKMPMVFARDDVQSPRKSAHGGSEQKVFLTVDPNKVKRTVLAGVKAKVLANVDRPSQLRAAFEVHDPQCKGQLPVAAFQDALATFGLSLADSEAKVLGQEFGGASGDGSLDYTRIIGMLFPVAISTRGKDTRRPTNTLSAGQIHKNLKEQVQRCLALGPEELRRSYGLFRMKGDEMLTAPQFRALLTDFSLTVTEAQVLGLIKHFGGSGGLLPYSKLISSILPDDYVLAEGIKSGVSIGASLLHRAKGPLSDVDFKDAFVARMRRQLMRNGTQGRPIGLQLREALKGLEGKWESVTAMELRRALVTLGVVVPEEELERLMKLYRVSGATKGCNITRLVEDVDPSAYDFIFSTGVVSAASMQLIKKEIECGDDESEAAVRNRLRQALRGRLTKDGMVNLIKEMRGFDSARDGRITKDDFVPALLHLGLKVHNKANVNRLWEAVTNGAASIDIMDLAGTLSRQDEYVRRKTRAEREKHVPFTLG